MSDQRPNVPPPAPHCSAAEVHVRRYWAATNATLNATRVAAERAGYIRGVRWGIVCGVVWASLGAALAMVAAKAWGWL